MKKAIYLTFFIFIIGILAYGYQQVYRKQEYYISLNFEYGKNIEKNCLKSIQREINYFGFIYDIFIRAERTSKQDIMNFKENILGRN